LWGNTGAVAKICACNIESDSKNCKQDARKIFAKIIETGMRKKVKDTNGQQLTSTSKSLFPTYYSKTSALTLVRGQFDWV